MQTDAHAESLDVFLTVDTIYFLPFQVTVPRNRYPFFPCELKWKGHGSCKL